MAAEEVSTAVENTVCNYQTWEWNTAIRSKPILYFKIKLQRILYNKRAGIIRPLEREKCPYLIISATQALLK